MSIDVYLEVGAKRVFAGALEWPGLCRSARDEAAALGALLDYAPRYRRSIGTSARGLRVPKTVAGLQVVERLRGDATTDFGAPGKAPARDTEPLSSSESKRLRTILQACWDAFDTAAASAGHLRKGPRGGGRDLAKMTAHVLEADVAYLRGLGGTYASSGHAVAGEMQRVRQLFLEALLARARGALPDRGPRGGARWTARYAVRRSAWHALDHAWEIEDRAEGP